MVEEKEKIEDREKATFHLDPTVLTAFRKFCIDLKRDYSDVLNELIATHLTNRREETRRFEEAQAAALKKFAKT